jgi:hypothetical protein
MDGVIKMIQIKWFWAPGKDPIILGSYDNKRLAWRFIHETLEEAYGDNYGEKEISAYDVVKVD